MLLTFAVRIGPKALVLKTRSSASGVIRLNAVSADAGHVRHSV